VSLNPRVSGARQAYSCTARPRGRARVSYLSSQCNTIVESRTVALCAGRLLSQTSHSPRKGQSRAVQTTKYNGNEACKTCVEGSNLTCKAAIDSQIVIEGASCTNLLRPYPPSLHHRSPASPALIRPDVDRDYSRHRGIRHAQRACLLRRPRPRALSGWSQMSTLLRPTAIEDAPALRPLRWAPAVDRL
jgi:hypothetical protein